MGSWNNCASGLFETGLWSVILILPMPVIWVDLVQAGVYRGTHRARYNRARLGCSCRVLCAQHAFCTAHLVLVEYSTVTNPYL